MTEPIVLSASVARLVSFAMHQASIPVITELRLRNDTGENVDGIVVEFACDPPVIATRRWTFDRIRAQSESVPSDMTVTLDAGLLYRLSERMRATVTITVTKDEELITSWRDDIVALARHEWGGSISTPELLAAFVTPNDPAVAEVLRDASEKLREHGRKPSMEGYQSQSRERVWEMASAMWAAVAGRRLIYAEPPASFESNGQKIRLPSEVLGQRLATCMDTALLFAAALEQAGLRPLICLTKGHALVGVWLQPATLLGVTTDDASDLRNYMKLGELIVFETTVVTSQPPATFSEAIQLGTQQLREALDDQFVLALDIRQARTRQITPLPAELLPTTEAAQTKFVSLPLDMPPTLGAFTVSSELDVPDTPQGRLDNWKRRLLDLTKRNRLLNLKPSKTAIRLVCADAAKLEDVLAEGSKITIVPFDSLKGRGGGRDADTLWMQQRVDYELALAEQALENHQVPARLTDVELKAGVVELFRKAKSDLAEGGANTLFLAIGMLKWRESETATTWFRAPLLLVPVRLERTTAASPPKLMQHTDDTVFNMTLLEMLRQDFELRVPSLEGELPTDSHGVDVQKVLTLVRSAIRDVPGWEVLDEMVLSTFSFSKYLMWKDLNDHSELLRETPFVRHMIDTPRELYDHRTPSFIPAAEQDERIIASDLFAPLPCDSSQVAAIHASGSDGDFVLEGPPGTGKSQTIANLIAHNLGLGRSVLFVAEKMTALNVVHDRLKHVGLGDFCLELHSSKANKKSVLAQLDRAWTNRGEKSAETWQAETAKLQAIRTSLNGLVRALHEPGASGMSPREAIARAAASEFAPAVKLEWAMDISADRARTPEELEQLRVLSRELGQAFAEVTPDDVASFAGLLQTDWSYQWQSQISASAAALVSAIDSATACAEAFSRRTDLPGSVDTLAELERLAEIAAAVPKAASMNLDAVLGSDGADVADRLRQGVQLLERFRELAGKLSTRYSESSISAATVGEAKRAWTDADRRIWPLSIFARKRAVREGMRALGAARPMDFAADLPVLERMAAIRAEMAKATDSLPAAALWRGFETDIAQVSTLIRLGEAARTATMRLAREPGDLPVLRQRIRTLFVDGRELLQPGMPVAASAEEVTAAVARLQAVGAEFAALAGLSWNESQQLARLRALALDIQSRGVRLNPWCQWQLRRQQAIGQGLGALVQALETGLLVAKDSVAAFDVAYARWIAPLLIDSREPLRRFSAVEHSRLIEEFRALDAEVARLAAETIRARVSEWIPRKSDADPTPGFGLLRREVQKKAGHVPVRKLVAEMGAALTRLTPCLLMSPHSVAQFFAAGQLKFDLVVFDEASQIAVWDAIGAIARGRDTIIVGDPKQMPPTNFFSRGADVDDTAEEDLASANVGDLESILDEGLAAGMHLHRLTGHYRSRHESLIAFSNHKYYGGELVTYPASVTQHSMVSLRRCNGAYQKGKERTNPEEAKAVVAEIVARLMDPARSKQSIGVVTMNSEQQRLIRNLLDDERRHRPGIEHAFKDASGEEVDMVYNLETVQGHERDVIMLSIGYGPTVAGDRTMSMNFGPLNRSGGERRLNVAVTRAIREVVVFASFDPDMIDLSRTTAQAVHDLKGYLEFAKRGPTALARQAAFTGGIDTFESVLEERVAMLLRARGWAVQTQVGVSKFRIDLGVVHPDYPGRFLAGVECDGASFHRSPTARDRDRVRHAVLSQLGWRLVRLWSTDFFRDPESAINRVHETLSGYLLADRDGARGADWDASTPLPGEVLNESGDAEAFDDSAADFSDPEESTSAESDATASDHASATPPQADWNEEATPGRIARPQTNAASAPAESAPFQHDAARFYEDAYLKALRPICLELIDRLGPVTFVHLAERVARAHGFLRTGKEIKKRVWAAVGRQRKTSKAPDGGVVFWPHGVEPVAHVPYRGALVDGEVRPWSAVPYMERLGLAVAIVKETVPEARLAAMAQRVGVARLGPKIRDELVELLESAEGLLE